jgi:hypothetical protein
MLPKVKEVLNTLLVEFKEGNIPEKIAYTIFPIINIPSSKWSLLNHLVMFIHETEDARGFRQWQEVTRYVKKGAKSFHILVPCLRKEKDEKTKEEVSRLAGFTTANVFRVEDTVGRGLDYEKIKLPNLPLLEKASEWGIEVKAVPGNYEHYGYYSPDKKMIALATPEESTFFHELCHVAHEKIIGTLKRGQDPFQEIVAELSAQALSRIVGKDGSKHLGKSYRYIESYAKEMKLSPHSAVVHVLSDVEKVLHLILKESDRKEEQHDHQSM